MIGCSKAPSGVDPGKSNVTPPSVVSPVNNTLTPSTGDAYCPPPVAPVVPPVVAPLPLCNYLAFTANIGYRDKLFLYDDILKDNWALVGAGEDINNPQYFNGGKVIYDRCGKILVYDILSECNLYLDDVNSVGFVHRPSISWAGDRMVFVDFRGRAYLWTCTPCALVCELAKVNALGRINWIRISADGHWAVFTTCDGCLYTYNIDLPQICLIADARVVCSGGRDSDLAFITHPAISATGRQIAFTAVNFDRKRCRPETTIWRYDRVLDCLDPMPFANAALNNDFVVDPMFKCFDEENIYYEAFIPGYKVDIDFKLCTDDTLADLVTTAVKLLCRYSDASFTEDALPALQNPEAYRNSNHRIHRLICEITDWLHDQSRDTQKVYGKIRAHDILEGFRVLDYNWVTEMVRTLTIVNNVHGDTDTLISDPDLFCCDDFKDGKGGYGNRDGKDGHDGRDGRDGRDGGGMPF
ncbi:MAG TPA: hypothetical protein DD435_07440 [Cyanobacteria bacterium UBA8530]|nr:hypothetical protein [Cyanobacteria bacterium UBA8530]